MDYAVTMSNVHKKVDEFQLESIDLKIEKGTISALIGKNGSGKSTLLKMVINLMKTDSGDIRLLGQFVLGDDESWKMHVAYLPQKPPMIVPFTGYEMKNLISQWYPTWDEPLFRKIVSLFGIDLSRKYSKLSPGAQQQLNLALVIARNAQVLILDEPTAHLDIPSKQILNDLLVEWMEKEDRTIILATHQVEEIRKLADYLVVLKDGRIFGQFEKEELIEMYKRYWFSQPLDFPAVPGEQERGEGSLTTNLPNEAEEYLRNENIDWTNVQTLELNEILAILLAK
ncbi:ATP-binding cassette domain-containing protein [Sporosarcina limicola]|uniref:ABC-2 type transport system ATP-binding protein n=1 Tax=Sporosarcina limicola TaxID=34101 RepID=A0A927MJS2_9BACL|nr:ABC transporter ATP-binding protein [Sporosarcina limicola]MBE1554247.1 ABC-2 type transport system ATP-binding protein [Sporosarcina limicola]